MPRSKSDVLVCFTILSTEMYKAKLEYPSWYAEERYADLPQPVKLTGQYGKFFNTKLVTYESLRALLVKC